MVLARVLGWWEYLAEAFSVELGDGRVLVLAGALDCDAWDVPAAGPLILLLSQGWQEREPAGCSGDSGEEMLVSHCIPDARVEAIPSALRVAGTGDRP